MIYHVLRSEFNQATRVKNQISIDKGMVLEKQKLISFELISLVLKEPSLKVLVFHQQSNLINLCLVLVLIFITKKNVNVIYDMHDLNELRSPITVKKIIRYRVNAVLERVVCRKVNKTITVSDGLSNIIDELYGISSAVFYNIPKNFAMAQSFERKKSNRAVYFGMIYEERLPISLLKEMVSHGFVIDIYGKFSNDHKYNIKFESFIKKSQSVAYCGQYTSEDIVEKLAGGLYKYSLMYFDSEYDNFRYCLPNKLFQSLEAGLISLTSSNLIELNGLFVNSKTVIPLNDFYDGVDHVADWKASKETVYKMQRLSLENYRDAISNLGG